MTYFHDTIEFSWSAVFSTELSFSEDFQCRKSADAKSIANSLLRCTINFRQCNRRVIRLQFGGSFFIFRSQSFAMTTPKSKSIMTKTNQMKFLRPHHGAKNSTKITSCSLIFWSKFASVKSKTSLARQPTTNNSTTTNRSFIFRPGEDLNDSANWIIIFVYVE